MPVHGVTAHFFSVLSDNPLTGTTVSTPASAEGILVASTVR